MISRQHEGLLQMHHWYFKNICDKYEIDEQEIDKSLTFNEVKKHFEDDLHVKVDSDEVDIEKKYKKYYAEAEKAEYIDLNPASPFQILMNELLCRLREDRKNAELDPLLRVRALSEYKYLDELVEWPGNSAEFKNTIGLIAEASGLKPTDVKHLIKERAAEKKAQAKAEAALQRGITITKQYISDKGVLTKDLAYDIINECHIKVISGTEKELAQYRPEKGVYEVGKSVFRLINQEINRRMILSGDGQLQMLDMSNYNKLHLIIAGAAPEIGSDF